MNMSEGSEEEDESDFGGCDSKTAKLPIEKRLIVTAY